MQSYGLFPNYANIFTKNLLFSLEKFANFVDMKWFSLLALLAVIHVQAADFLHSLPDLSEQLPGYAQYPEVCSRLEQLPLCRVEGVWQMVGDGATICVERIAGSDREFRMVMLRCPNRHVRPGTVIGHVQATVKPATYRARLYTDMARRTGLNMARDFILTVSDDDLRLVFTTAKKVSVNLWKLLPYMYRHTVKVEDRTPHDLNGAVRIFPPSDVNPLEPRYL